MADTSLQIVISGKDNFSGTANRVLGSLNQISTSASRVGRGIGQVAGGLSRLAFVAGGAVAGGLAASARAGADFEAQLNTINTIAHATPANLAGIGDGIRKLARQGRGDLADLTAGFYDILSAGITDSAKAQGVLDAATRLSIGGLSTNAEAVDILTTAINAYGQDASQAAADADLFAKAIEIGKVKANEIAASFANVAPIAAQTGIEIQEVAAAYGALTAQGTPAAEVTTQMSRAILDLLSPNKELNTLQKETGLNFMALAKEKGLVVALQAMRDAVKGDDQAFKDLFGRVEGYKFALQTTGPQQAIYTAALEAMGHSAGTATAQMEERTHGLAFSVKRFGANLRDAGIVISTGFLPALERTVNKFTDFIGLASTQGDLRRFGEDIGKALDAIDWQGVLDGAKTFVGLLKDAFTILNALPDQIKIGGAALITAFNVPVIGPALGQVGKGLGNIGLGLLGGLGAAAGGKVGALAGLVAQPVRVVNWPIGFGSGGTGAPSVVGGGGGLLGKILKVAVVGAVVVEGLQAWLSSFGPFIERNNALGAQGLTPGEIEAQKYYTADAATQQAIFKHLGRIPSREDWLSGQAKLADAQTGGKSPEERDAAAAAIAASVARNFGTHEAATGAFGSAELKAFRGGDMSLLDERIRYLSGAQGSGAGSESFLALVGRDIASLKADLPNATAAEAAEITAAIVTLQGILEAKKFEMTPETLAAVASPTDRFYNDLEDRRAKTDTSYDALERSRLNRPDIKNDIRLNPITNVTVNLSWRDIQTKVTTQSRIGPATGSAGRQGLGFAVS